jgi:late competence protein required for DNA uptake (superfamily II DNA/RNA helicase)
VQSLKEQIEKLNKPKGFLSFKQADLTLEAVSDVDLWKSRFEKLFNKLACATCKGDKLKECFLPCFHMFCRDCLEMNIETRKRRCPLCRLHFDRKDIKNIHWCTGDT